MHWQRIARQDGLLQYFLATVGARPDGRYLKKHSKSPTGTNGGSDLIPLIDLASEQGWLWQPVRNPVDQAQMQVRVVLKEIGRMAFAWQDPDFCGFTAFPDRRKQPGKEW